MLLSIFHVDIGYLCKIFGEFPLEKYLFKPFAYFLIVLSFYCEVVNFFMYSVDT